MEAKENKMKPLDHIQSTSIFLLTGMAVFFPIVFLEWAAGQIFGDLAMAVENHGWRETESPRLDLQCWVRWSDPKTTVCAHSLTSTHGASQ